MQPPHQHQRINLAELKGQLIKKLGPERSKQYFYYLTKFLSLKLSKVEFNRVCVQIVGRENIPLHNQFIQSILKNACSAKVPPLPHHTDVLNPVTAVGSKELPREGCKQAVHNQLFLSKQSNGDILPLSPRKVRTGVRGRKVLEHPRAFGPNGKTHFVSHASSAEQPERDNNANGVVENGNLTPHDISRLVLHHQELGAQDKDNGEVSLYHSSSVSVSERLPDGSISFRRKDPAGGVFSKDRNEISARSLLRAPLGVPSCQVSVGGARRGMPLASCGKYASTLNSGCMLETTALRERMEQIATTQGLQGVTVDSANLLNNGLDAYLRRLITSCIKQVGARSGHEPRNSRTNKHQARLKVVNGVIPGGHHHIQSNSRSVEDLQERKPHPSVSLLDFRVAMEVNPQQLGEDWPLLLEKICTCEFEE